MTDKKPSIPPELNTRIFERTISGQRNTKLDLAITQKLAESKNNHLELIQQKPPIFALFLSAAKANPQ